MQQILLVFIGGGIGSVLRYVIGLHLNRETIPYGTLSVNVIGSLLIGIFMGYYLKKEGIHLSESHIALIVVGLFGGFTTFSSFMYENFQFLMNEQYFRFVGYTILSLFLGILAVVLGYLIGYKTILDLF